MITISILGLDQFVVGHYSKDSTGDIAKLLGCEESLVNFYSPNAMVFHAGVEQTSWNTIVIVRAPVEYKKSEDALASYLIETLKGVSINIEVEFEYFESSSHHEFINEAYPRYISGDSIRSDEDEEPSMPEGYSENDTEEEVYLGDAFAGFEEKLAAKNKGN